MSDQDRPIHATWFDGRSARAHQVIVQPHAAEALHIVDERTKDVIARWPVDRVRAVSSHKDDLARLSGLTLRLDGAHDEARLVVEGHDGTMSVVRLCPRLQSADHEGARATTRIIAWSLAAVASLVLIVVYGMPRLAERMTPLVPEQFAITLGDTVTRQFMASLDADFCREPDDAVAALNALALSMAREVEPGFDAPLLVQVVDDDLPNAFAVPGGRIILFRGLIEKARGPDQLASVLAHEVGHVVRQDAMRSVLHGTGNAMLLGFLLGDVTGGGAVLTAGQFLLNNSYSREAERKADRFAVTAMSGLGGDATALGEMLREIDPLMDVLDELDDEEEVSARAHGDGQRAKRPYGLLEYLSTHPMTPNRMADIEAMAHDHKVATPRPVMDASTWEHITDLCKP